METPVKLQLPKDRVYQGAGGDFYVDTPNGQRKCTSEGHLITRIRASKKKRKKLKKTNPHLYVSDTLQIS